MTDAACRDFLLFAVRPLIHICMSLAGGSALAAMDNIEYLCRCMPSRPAWPVPAALIKTVTK